MSTRTTEEVKTASGHSVVHNTYITAGEKRQITEVYLEAGDMNRTPEPGEKRAAFRAEDKTVELVIVSLDGSSENILGRILEMPTAEADEVLDIVKNVIDPKKK